MAFKNFSSGNWNLLESPSMTFLPMKKVEVRLHANLHAHIPTKPSLNTELGTLKVAVNQIQGRVFKSRKSVSLLLSIF